MPRTTDGMRSIAAEAPPPISLRKLDNARNSPAILTVWNEIFRTVARTRNEYVPSQTIAERRTTFLSSLLCCLDVHPVTWIKLPGRNPIFVHNRTKLEKRSSWSQIFSTFENNFSFLHSFHRSVSVHITMATILFIIKFFDISYVFCVINSKLSQRLIYWLILDNKML